MSIDKKIIIFIGAPGSGKGSLAQLCVQNLGWLQLSTGFLCRKHIAEQTELGKQIDFCIKSGKLISDDLVLAMVEEWMIASGGDNSHIILDGFPRTISQAQAFSDFLTHKMPLSKIQIVKLVVSDDTVVDRLALRFICKNKDCQMIYSMAENKEMFSSKVKSCQVCSSDLVRRPDDEREVVRERLKVYRSYEQSLLDFFVNSGKDLVSIDVEMPLIKVFENLKLMIGVQPS